MSRRSEQARGIVACGVLLGALELLSIAAASRSPAVDDPSARWQRASADAVTADAPLRAEDDGAGAETQASLLLGQQVLARLDGALQAARIDVARPGRRRADSRYGRFCPVARGCD